MPQKLENGNMDLPDITEVLEETKQVIQKCFTQFQLDEVFFSFNGGKDCTVLLDVTIDVLKSMYKREDVGKDLKVIYIRTTGPFKELEKFVEEIEGHYKIKLIVAEGDMKEVLRRIIESDKNLKACLMGTRRTDPYSEHLKFMQQTDDDWPQFLRVSPLLNWTYHQIWSYILQRRVPYCSLYDKGYTSIGSTSNTWPNQALAYSENGVVSYRPAWQLRDATLERAGRGKHYANGHAHAHAHAHDDIQANL
ncbi:FAD synthase [Papilio machaon]|uniref:FAD synthase n=1 Tax=Papilio machaon TaxID=76193 RepID=UPI001E662D29|nr:FAD synthase [Papilio machaon]XP_045534245.1 FAD synthase [Papilio machaon]